MARLNIERQQRLEPTRIEYAVKCIEELGYEVIHRDSQMIKFVHKVHPVKGKRRTYPPYRERLHARETYTRKPYWHRTRSNPKRRRKPH